MSAWYLFAALGLYPLRVGSPDYAVGSPLFPRAEVRPQGGAPITITARGQARDNHYVQSLQFNGQPVDSASLDAEALARGGTLEFVLGPEPSSWAAAADRQPPSLTGAGQQPAPLVDLIGDAGADSATAALFDDDSRTEVGFHRPDADDVVIAWSLAAPAQAAFYTITSGASEGDPSGWRLEASVDGKDWALLDERVDQTFRWRRQTRPFALSQPAAYQHYRLVITAAAEQFAISELELLA